MNEVNAQAEFYGVNINESEFKELGKSMPQVKHNMYMQGTNFPLRSKFAPDVRRYAL